MLLTTLRQRNFALLWLGGLISQTGDWLLIIGLPVYVYTQTGSVLATSLTLITGFVPGLLFGSLAGVLVDRWDRKWTLIISNLLLAIGLLPLLAVHSKASLWMVYPVLFFESTLEQVVLPAENALLPSLVSEELLVSANALISVSSNTSRLAGAALGGVLLGLFGLGGVALLDALSFVFVSAMVLFISMPTKSAPSREGEVPAASVAMGKQLVHEWLEGLQPICVERTLTILLIAFILTGFGEGIFGVLLVVFVKQVLLGGAVVYGSLLAAQAVGSLIGGLAIGHLGNRIPPLRLVGIGLAIFGFLDLLIIDLPLFVPGLLLVFVLFILVGLPSTGALVGFNASVQILVEDQLRGRIFGTLLAMRSSLTLLGMVVAGTLGDRLGPVLLLNAQGGIYLFSGLLVLFTLWKGIAGKRTFQGGRIGGRAEALGHTENSVTFSGVKRRATRDCWTKAALTCGRMPSSFT
ncbi:MAG TPA: MFS transporter [Ktedonobacteraceae bacterium]|nr:MFS transporter [Ktedonobacteraceae bacterium]